MTAPNPPVNPDLLYDSFLGVMRFERGMWELTFNVFLKNPMTDLASNSIRGHLLQLTSPNLFSYLRQCCSLSVLTGVSSLLLDDVWFGRNETKPNLVLRRVIDELIPENTPERSQIEAELKEAVKLAKPLNESRNKLLAHNDLSWNLKVFGHDLTGAPYPGNLLTVCELEQIMSSLIRITNWIVSYRRPGSSWYWDEPEIDRFFETLSKGLKSSVKPGE